MITPSLCLASGQEDDFDSSLPLLSHFYVVDVGVMSPTSG